MTIQLPKVDTIDPRLLSDNSKQSSPDFSFAEKLNEEKARLGLPFLPFAQLGGLFSYPDSFFGNTNFENNFNLTPDYDGLSPQPPKPSSDAHDSRLTTPSSAAPQIFEAMPARSFNRQALQELLTKTNWLVPNLAARPLLTQAFESGRLMLSYDLQTMIDEIVKQAQLVKDKGKTELSMSLNSQDLGDIFLKLTSQAGLISVQILASPEARKLISDSRLELERALKKAHLQVSEVRIEEVKNNA